jgi:ABC-type sulfate transport system permease component
VRAGARECAPLEREGRGLLVLVVALILVFSAMPAGRLVAAALFPGGVFSPERLTEILGGRSAIRAAAGSLETAFWSSLLALGLGSAMAVAVASTDAGGRRATAFLFVLSTMISPQVAALAFLSLAGPASPVLHTLGMAPTPGSANPFLGREGIIVVLGLHHAPLVFVVLIAGLKRIPSSLIEAAEGVEVGQYGADRLIFVGAERASVVGVYRDTGVAPELVQVLPTGIGPEGLLAIPSRNLFVATSETDLHGKDGAAPHVMIYERAERATPAYPTIRSARRADGLPIGWGALSGLTADRRHPGKLYAITDSIYSGAPRILTIDATQTPALITGEILVTRNGAAAEKLDLEGITTADEGGFWLASEGNPERGLFNRLIKVDANGAIQDEIALPGDLEKGAKAAGYEGVTVTGSGADITVWLAVQREWADDEKGTVKLLAYKPSTKTWGAIRYPLDATDGGWVGLSEITAAGDRFVFIERDNQIAEKARVKRLYAVPVVEMKPTPLSQPLPVVKKTAVRDLMFDLKAPKGYVLDKVEGFAVDAAGNAFVVTDNDGVDDSSGETQFVRLGKM